MTQPIATHDLDRLEATCLPKWPQMLVWGAPVTQEQAKDIILRTDRFFSEVTNFPGGSNRRWIEWAQAELGFRHLVVSDLPAARRRASEAESALRKALGTVRTEYVHNTWASSSFGIPYGWCHPDGTIWYEYNVGSHPGTRCLFEEWQTIAEAFPYLDLTVTFFDGERLHEDREPVISFRVQNGHVTLLDAPVVPKQRLVPPPERTAVYNSVEEEFAASNGLPDDWIREYGATTRAALAAYQKT